MANVFSLFVILLAISAAMIGLSAVTPLQHANAVSNDDGMNGSCRQNHHPSDTSKKCSKNDTPLILPFP
jgi:hypothetical protein